MDKLNLAQVKVLLCAAAELIKDNVGRQDI